MTFKQKRFLAIMLVACPTIAMGRLIVQSSGWDGLFWTVVVLGGVLSFIVGIIWLLSMGDES